MPHTLVFYESPFRVGKFLEEAAQVFGERQAAVCLEITKQFERCSRGTLPMLASEFADGKLKGEAVIVIEGNHDKRHLDRESDTGEEQ